MSLLFCWKFIQPEYLHYGEKGGIMIVLNKEVSR